MILHTKSLSVFLLALACQFSAQTVVSGQTVTPDSNAAVNGSISSQNKTTESNTQTTNTENKEVLALNSKASNSKTEPVEKASTMEQNASWKKAITLYSKKAYAEAIPYFEKSMQADSTNKLLLTKLGDCYRLTNNTPGKLLCYGTLVRTGNADPIHELYYGQALMENGEAEKAQPFFLKYGADSRGQNLASSFGKTKSYTRNADAYSLTLAPFNSPESDICATKYFGATVFASSRPKNAWIRKKQGWTKGDYMNVFATDKDEKGLDKEPAQFLKDLDTKYNDGPICFNKDFYLIYYTTNNARKSERATDGTFKLRILEGELGDDGFSMVRLPAFNNKEYNYAHPSLSTDGRTIYFSSDQPGGKGGMDIYMSKKDSSGEWGPAINLGDLINTAGNEMFPFVTSGGLLYFASNGHDGLGGLDLYETKLKNGEPTRIFNMGVPVNSRFDDFGIYLVEDGKSGFITSNRKAGGMDDDIYLLNLSREVRRGKDVLLLAKSKETGEPIANAKLLVNTDTVFTNEKGEYITMVNEDAKVYIKSLKDDFFDYKDSIASADSDKEAFTKDIILEKNPKLFLRALITDARTNELLEGVHIKIIDMHSSETLDVFTTTAGGDYFKFLFNTRVGDKLTYLIKLEKPGYLERSVIFAHTISKPGEVNMNEQVNLTLGKVEVGMDLAKMIDIAPIYFDLGKSTIRTDAAAELDKIVQIMNEYPEMEIELGSHTDCRSSAIGNMRLSSERAKASVNYIIKKGIAPSRITGRGYGETKLLNNCACEGKTQSNCPEEEHMKNRRTEFLITKINAG